MRRLRITVEHSRTPKRVWLKATDDAGFVMVVRNVAYFDAVKERNRLVEEFSNSGDFDEVSADPIPEPGVAPRKGNVS